MDAANSVTDWLSAVGQLAGAVGTVAAVGVALGVAFRDRAQRRREVADAAAAQARLVTTRVHRGEGRVWAETTNHSGAPVFDVEVTEVRLERRSFRTTDVPGTPAAPFLLAPGRTLDMAVAADPTTVGDEEIAGAVATVRFLDAHGLCWLRSGREPPRRVL